MSKYGLDPYATIGLTENPFVPRALGADVLGKRLLVGRDEEVTLVGRRLHKNGKITCLDGHVGVGKTSLVNVAAFDCFQAYLAGETEQLLIPSVVSFQLKPNGSVDQFCAEVFQGVAQTLIQYQEHLQKYDIQKFPLPQIHTWLNSPIVQHLNATAKSGFRFGVPSVASVSVEGGVNTSNQVNQSAGFSQSGFESLVRQLLNEIFTVRGNGGVVCVIDNIELLENGMAARKMLEALRDKLFNVNGLRWVFCGANGVIHSLAGSPRLTAFLNPVIKVANVKPSAIIPLVRARLQEYSTDAKEVERELPVALEDLELLYRIVNSNLRDLLALADEFCEYCVQSGRPVRTSSTRKEKFERWLEKATGDRYDDLSSRVSQNAWAVLDVAMSSLFQGTFGAAEYSSFNQNSTVSFVETTFKKWLSQLEKLGLISKESNEGTGDSSEDDSESGKFSRDVFTVTAKGALVHYARRKRRENLSVADDPEWMRPIHHVDTSAPRKTNRY
ncbi:ATP-binding protein [Caballeronia sp. INML1]|uniref:ATP-binding protein n=1 Tax=Caballeronia sp. INML1 TaxID=2921760 RepID=UPI002027D09D|nr:ATP-binding protein [Caballeronia sp. INML1]